MNTTSGELHKTTGFVFPGMALPTPEQGDKCNISLYDERDLQPYTILQPFATREEGYKLQVFWLKRQQMRD